MSHGEQAVASPSPALLEARQFFDQLNRDYVQVHQTKEDLFWSTYMAISDDHEGFAAAERAYKSFIADPARLGAVRRHIAAVTAAGAGGDGGLLHGLQGWRAFFEAHVIEGAEAAAHMASLVEAEAALFKARQAFALFHIDEGGERVEATLAMLATNLSTNPRADRRRSSHEALRQLEHWVLDHGYLEIVSLRNRFARALGFADYVDYKVRPHDRMTPAALFALLDELLARTDAANRRALAALQARHGNDAVRPWNLRDHMSGDVVRHMDPYVPFAKALRRWTQSFRRLGVQFRGAAMQLDLLERKGKYQNGFCHGPMPAFQDAGGRWIPARINFTAEATPNQIGSGWRALNTLFHEGGHAAHFANVRQNAPCFSQEYAPTSAAYAETQSMFCDRLLDDADWLVRYAHDAAGEPMPRELIRARIESIVPFRAFDERSLALVSYFEAALYAMDEEARTPDAVLRLARDTELRVLGVPAPRPLLSVPHLLNQESSAAYHGYLLAHMAVYQTRAALVDRVGYLTDNPEVGSLLARHYWEPGNSVDHDGTLRRLTGEGLSGRALADACNETAEEAWAAAAASIGAAAARRYPDSPPTLDATIRVVHGTEVLADNGDSDDAMCEQFERWVTASYTAT